MIEAAVAGWRKICRQICRQIFREETNPSLPVTACPRGQLSGAVVGMSLLPPEREAVIKDLTRQILDLLSPDSRDLGAAVIARVQELVGDLPASADHHHSEPYGLLQHSLGVGLKMLQESEKMLITKGQSGARIDALHAPTDTPQWQYLCLLAGLSHDLGKLLDIDVWARDRRWFPLHETYVEFLRQVKTEPVLRWKERRVRGAHAHVSSWLLSHLLTNADIDFIGLERLPQLTGALTGAHTHGQSDPLGNLLRRLDQKSVEEAAPEWMKKQPDSKVNLFVRALRNLIRNGELAVNSPGAPVYVTGDKAAVVVPRSVLVVREFLKRDDIKLPSNHHLYDLLAQARLVEADEERRCVHTIKVPGKHGPVELSALIFDRNTIVPEQIIPTLPQASLVIKSEKSKQPNTKAAIELNTTETHIPRAELKS